MYDVWEPQHSTIGTPPGRAECMRTGRESTYAIAHYAVVGHVSCDIDVIWLSSFSCRAAKWTDVFGIQLNGKLSFPDYAALTTSRVLPIPRPSAFNVDAACRTD